MHDWDDYMIVMAIAVAGMVAGGAEIDTAESVAVSYPGFFEEMARIWVCGLRKFECGFKPSPT